MFAISLQTHELWSFLDPRTDCFGFRSLFLRPLQREHLVAGPMTCVVHRVSASLGISFIGAFCLFSMVRLGIDSSSVLPSDLTKRLHVPHN